MADTLAEAFSSGWKSGVDIQNYGEQEKAQTSMLSTQAEAGKMKLEQAKEESMYSQLTKQAFLKAQESNASLDAADMSQRIKLYDVAIQNSKNNPELQDRLFTQKQGLLSQQADQLKIQGEIHKQQQQARAEFVMSALTTPEIGADNLITRGQEEGDKLLTTWGLQLKDQYPIMMFGGKKKYSQLTPEQQDAYKSTVLRGITPKGETTAHNLFQEQYNWEKLRADEEDKTRRSALKAQEIAAAKEKQAAKAADTSRLTIEVNKEVQQHRKNIRSLEVEQAKIKELYGIEKDITEEGGLPLFKSPKMPPAAQERYKLLTDQIAEEEQGIKEQTARLEAAGATKVPKGKTQGTGTKEDPIKLD